MEFLRITSQCLVLLTLSALSPSFASECPLFTDVSMQAGLRCSFRAHAVSVEDFDGDGNLDVALGGFDAPYVQLWRGAGKLRFTNATDGSGLAVVRGSVSGFAVGDYDSDGRPDLFVGVFRQGNNRLFRNMGSLRFVDVTERVGDLGAGARSCSFADVDNDGRLDLFVCCPNGPNRLLRQNDDGTFADVAGQMGVALPQDASAGVCFGDVNGDGKADLFVANYLSQVDRLLLNSGGLKFRDVSQEAGIALRASSLGAALADLDNDGDLDAYVATCSWLSGVKRSEAALKARGMAVEPNQLYLNDGQGRFERFGNPVLDFKGLAHDVCIEDFDQDGDLDVYVAVDGRPKQRAATRGGNPCYRNEGDGRTWREVSQEWGLHHVANCVCAAAADFDNDGDQDVLLVSFDREPTLLRNNVDRSDYLIVRAEGAGSNRSGIGAQIRMYESAEGERPRKLRGFREIQSGWGYCKSGPLSAHFGLDAKRSYRLEILFPATEKKIVRENVRPGQSITVREREE